MVYAAFIFIDLLETEVALTLQERKEAYQWAPHDFLVLSCGHLLPVPLKGARHPALRSTLTMNRDGKANADEGELIRQVEADENNVVINLKLWDRRHSSSFPHQPSR